ncbi:MAG: hypothetical protein JST85_05125 [Acidobacteria bacterium]|nr:hypothetical protein [Acidobacteriota bacterium]
MRNDMSKVVVERPRRGHSLKSGKTARRIKRYDESADYGDLPKRVSGSRNKHVRSSGNQETKSFSDLLGPLRRYLRRNVGKPWDKVYSELAQHLDKRKTTGIHIFDHVKWEVEQDCFVGEDGKIYRFGYRRIERVSGLYVHPRTGLLCWSDAKSIWHKSLAEKRAERKRQTGWRVPISGNRHYVKLSGIWYFADLERYNRSQRPPEEEVKMTFVEEGQTTWRVTNKRQCSRKELKAADLRNDQPA